ncbi:MAG TPA: alpha/beta fold hydrolase [Thermoanaerobaculia bacterium]
MTDARVLDSGGDREVRYLFAHGAGASMDSAFMNEVADAIAERGVRVIRFEFPYMAARREGARKPPDPQPRLLATWRRTIEAHRGAGRVFIGGKSMGGRIATMVADDAGVDGVVCFGYPFHPPGKPEQLRTAHLESIRTPLLIVQGTRDALGSREEVPSMHLAPSIRIEWIEDGDHSLKPRARSGMSYADAMRRAVDAAARFMLGSTE